MIIVNVRHFCYLMCGTLCITGDKSYVSSILKKTQFIVGTLPTILLHQAWISVITKSHQLKLCFMIPILYCNHRRLCRVKHMLAMYLKYHKAGLTPTSPVTSTAISPVKMSIGRKLLTNLRSEMIFLQGNPVFCISSYHLHPHTDR